jgi:hypothetical protein
MGRVSPYNVCYRYAANTLMFGDDEFGQLARGANQPG